MSERECGVLCGGFAGVWEDLGFDEGMRARRDQWSRLYKGDLRVCLNSA
jgi:hypothetical protein